MVSDELLKRLRELDRMKSEIGLSSSLSCATFDVIRSITRGNSDISYEMKSIGNILCRNLLSTAGGEIGADVALSAASGEAQSAAPADSVLRSWFEGRNTGELVGGNPTPVSLGLATLGRNLPTDTKLPAQLAATAYDLSHGTRYSEDLTGRHYVHSQPSGYVNQTDKNKTQR